MEPDCDAINNASSFGVSEYQRIFRPISNISLMIIPCSCCWGAAMECSTLVCSWW